MGTILQSIDHSVDTFDRPDFNPDEIAADGGVTVGMVLLEEMRVALERVRRQVCLTCEGNGFVNNPSARWSQDYCEGRATGVYSTNDPEEIDCPDCSGVGFVARRPPQRPPTLPKTWDDEVAF